MDRKWETSRAVGPFLLRVFNCRFEKFNVI
jgi:hypothetical protein